MSQYNKTVLTRAGLELAKRANAGQAKFGITRAVTSADDWSHKTVQDLEEVTTIPNIMQQGTIMDTDEVESNNSVIGVSLCFTNKNLSTGYQIRIIGLYVKEEGQENDFLYAVTTAITPEYMPSFADKVLYRFNMQLYLVIGKTQAVNIVINDGASVTHKQFDNYKGEVTASLEKIENAHKEDMSHVAKSASINGGAEILPDSTGKLNLVVPDPDLSKYVSLEQLTETLKTKADITAIPDKTATEEGIKQAKELAQEADTKAQNALDNKADKTTVEENLATKANQSDLDQTNAEVAKKANSEDVSTDISNLQNQINSKTTGTIITDYDIASKTPTKKTDRYNNKWLVDQNVLGQFADQINQLKGRRTVDAQDFNNLTDTGTYYVSNPGANKPTGSWGNLFVSNGDGHRTSQVYYPDNGSAPWCRSLNESNWLPWYQLSTKKDISNAINKFDLSKVKFRKQYINGDGHTADKTWSATKNDDGTYTIDLYNDDWTTAKLADVIAQLPSKANASDVYTKDQIDVAFRNRDNSISSLINQVKQIDGETVIENAVDVNTLVGTPNQIILYKLPNTGNTNTPSWIVDHRGVMIVLNYDGNAKTQIWTPVGSDAFNEDGTFGWRYWESNNPSSWNRFASVSYVDNLHTDLQNQIRQLKDNQFEVQTFTDATAAANWEAQKPGKRMAIVNS